MICHIASSVPDPRDTETDGIVPTVPLQIVQLAAQGSDDGSYDSLKIRGRQ